MCRTDDTFLSGKPGIVKTRQKTLEWPTINSELIKLHGFENRVFYTFTKDWMHIRAHLITFRH